LQLFSNILGVFTSVLDSCFKCFIYLILYVATIIYTCFKCRSGVAHGMCIKSGGWRGRRLGRRGRCLERRGRRLGGMGPLLVCSLSSPMCQALARSLCGHRPDTTAWIGHPGASKSVNG
jgi:hypothetical protein